MDNSDSDDEISNIDVNNGELTTNQIETNFGELETQLDKNESYNSNNEKSKSKRKSGSHYDNYSSFNSNFNKNKDDIIYSSYDDINLPTSISSDYKTTYKTSSKSKKIEDQVISSEYTPTSNNESSWVPKWIWDSSSSNKNEYNSSNIIKSDSKLFTNNVSVNNPSNTVSSNGINIINNIVPNPAPSNPVTLVSVQSSPQFIPVPMYDSYSSNSQSLFSDYRDYPSNINNSYNSNRNFSSASFANSSIPVGERIFEPGQDKYEYNPPMANQNVIVPYSPLNLIHRIGRNIVLGYLLYYFIKFVFSNYNLRHSSLLRWTYYNSFIRLGISSVLIDWLFQNFYVENSSN